MKKTVMCLAMLALASVATAKEKQEPRKPQIVMIEPNGMVRPITPADNLRCVVLTEWGGIQCWEEKQGKGKKYP